MGWTLVLTALLLVALVPLALSGNRKLTQWVDSSHFQWMLGRETSKGLKLEGTYTPLARTGFLGLATDSFSGAKGKRTIVSLEAHGITGWFNPFGILLRRWQIEDIHLKSGVVHLQKTEPTEGAPPQPSRPLWALFLPNRVYLADVKVDDANILWELKNQESGIYHTFLEITPNGRDFEYDAHGGEFRDPLTPAFQVRHAHVLIRKPRLYCSDFFLGDDDNHPDRGVRCEGDAGLQQDRSIHLKIDLLSLKIAALLAPNLRSHLLGLANGHFNYTSTGTGLESAQGQGSLAVADGVLHALPPLRHYFAVTGTPDPGDLSLKVCQTDLEWKQGAISAKNLKIESEGVFRLEGNVTVAGNHSLSGELQLGVTDPYIHWLPTARQVIFTRDDGPYHFRTIHLSGTLQKPQQDLSDRVSHEVAKSPLLAVKLFFNQVGDWFNFKD
ncbi:MAG: hypothetical protein LV479_12290 [Methylacidiphilales bacterium]|nr:hypothetical protein [Candidatus Methylacidiphilales bacterium]